jgi:hypothetical protein
VNCINLTESLQQLEEDLLRPDVRRNPERIAQLLADDFREFGASGRIYGKAEILAALSTEAPAQIQLTDFACHQLTAEIALVTYQSQRTDANGTRGALRSSVWIRRENRWQMLFHQGTRLESA